MDTTELTERVRRFGEWAPRVREEMHRVLVGQEHLIDGLLLGLLTNGHVLLEGVPGLAKTLAIKALSGCLDASFSRIQFTPDLLPSDLVGTLIYNQRDGSFAPRLGPVFANLVLADEINRSPAKVQSALLEAMQERQVTIGEVAHPLPDPFLVMATQNPIEQEGTYQLPEAQLDRFLLKVVVNYPAREEERRILELMSTSMPDLETRPVVATERIRESRKLVNEIFIDDVVKDYIVDLVHLSRDAAAISEEHTHLIRCGASPRGTIYLALAARAKAFLEGRGYVTPQDVKDVAPEVLRHRILLTYEAEAEQVSTDSIVSDLLRRVPVP